MIRDTTYYVRDRRSGEIVNAIATSKSKSEISLDDWVDGEHLYLDENPPLEVLKRYEFWDKRP